MDQIIFFKYIKICSQYETTSTSTHWVGTIYRGKLASDSLNEQTLPPPPGSFQARRHHIQLKRLNGSHCFHIVHQSSLRVHCVTNKDIILLEKYLHDHKYDRARTNGWEESGMIGIPPAQAKMGVRGEERGGNQTIFELGHCTRCKYQIHCTMERTAHK